MRSIEPDKVLALDAIAPALAAVVAPAARSAR
jgi:hypothetical protein